MDADATPSLNAVLDLLQSAQALEHIVALQTKLTAHPAMAPEQGGDGESKKALVLEEYMHKLNVPLLASLPAQDPRVSDGKRPNLLYRIEGRTAQTLWLFAHLDVVAAGDRTLWSQDPWVVTRKGDWLYGRGVEDNQQAIASMYLLAWALATAKVTPERNLGLVFMADEECGSTYGLAEILRTSADFFHKDDIYVVPDFGRPDSSVIEIAEKAILWLTITTEGVQCHASTPDAGKNAYVCSCAIVTELMQRLPKLFPQTDPLFSPACSTFVASPQQPSCSGINILPGRDRFALDCRILPGIALDDVEDQVRSIATSIAQKQGVAVTVERTHYNPSSQTSPNEASIALLQKAVSQVYGCTPHLMGLGGGTVAALLRARNLPALVWATLSNTCHMPDEHSSLHATRSDSAVFARLLFAQ